MRTILLVPDAIARVISTRLRKGEPPSPADVKAKLEEVLEGLKDETVQAMADYLQHEDARLTVKGAIGKAQTILNPQWATLEGRCSVVSGKAALRALSRWSAQTYGSGFTAITVAKAMHCDEIDDDVTKVLRAIENLSRIPA